MVMQGHRMRRHDECPEPLYELMKICWSENYKDRPSFEDLLNRLASFEKAPPPIPPPQQLIKVEEETLAGYGETPQIEAEKYVWFEEPDDFKAILNGKGELVYATMRKLVEFIWRAPPGAYQLDLLYGYSRFIAPNNFLDLLLSAYSKQKDKSNQIKYAPFLFFCCLALIDC
jgi:hypothetical protein